MRQTNFPDQKALTARSETNSESNQPSCAGFFETVVYLLFSLSSPRTKGMSKRTHSLLYRSPRYQPTSHHCFGQGCRKRLSFRSKPSLPYAKLPRGWSRLSIFPESHLSHLCEVTMNTHFLTASWSNHIEDILPFFTGPSHFGQSSLFSPFGEARGPLSLSTAGLVWECKGMCREQGFSTQKPLCLVQCGVGLNQPDACALILPPLGGF